MVSTRLPSPEGLKCNTSISLPSPITRRRSNRRRFRQWYRDIDIVTCAAAVLVSAKAVSASEAVTIATAATAAVAAAAAAAAGAAVAGATFTGHPITTTPGDAAPTRTRICTG